MLPLTQHAPPLTEQSQQQLADFHPHPPDQFAATYPLTQIVTKNPMPL